MSSALERFTIWRYPSKDTRPTEMFRLFLTDPDFDPDLDGSWESTYWRWCADNEVLQVILQNQPLDFHKQPLDLTLETALSLLVIDAFGFLQCIGLQASDRRLAALRSHNGDTVLHYVARRLRFLSHSEKPPNQSQQWVALGADVLRHGASPSSVMNMHSTQERQRVIWRSTPLMEYLDIHIGWRLHDWYQDEPRALTKPQIWAEMLQKAGLDLIACGAIESEIWKSLQVQDYSKPGTEAGIEVVELVYGPIPAHWSFKTSYCWSFEVYSLRPPPGAFNDELGVPAEIIWTPINQERDEGPWGLVETKTHMEHVALIGSTSFPAEAFVELVDGTQDDSGVIVLMQHRVTRALRASPRSSSQPPCLRRREVAYYARQSGSRRQWLPQYHLCPFDSRWRFGCVGSDFCEMQTNHSGNGKHSQTASNERSSTSGVVSKALNRAAFPSSNHIDGAITAFWVRFSTVRRVPG